MTGVFLVRFHLNCTSYAKAKVNLLDFLYIVATYPCDSELLYRNFVTSAVSPIVAHSAIIAASASTSCSVTSVTCPTTTYSNIPAASSITAYCVASIASFNASHPVVATTSPITA